MKKRRHLALWIAAIAAAAVAGTAGYFYWRLSHLTIDFSKVDADATGQIMVSAFAPLVLAPGIDGAEPSSDESQGLLGGYQKNPELVHKRYLLVITWMHAAEIRKAIGSKPTIEGRMRSSISLEGVPWESRVDGWGIPYCVLVDSKQMTFLSSGGNGAIECAKLQKTAQQAALNASGPCLTRAGNLLATVMSRKEDPMQLTPSLGNDRLQNSR